MDLIKKPYEISLWEDQLVFVGKSGTPYTKIEEAKEEIVSQFYKEIKIATIGSNTMESPARCSGAKLSRKVNGENSLTFNMYYRYWDDDTQDFVTNPFIGLMSNERKVKLRIGEPGEKAEWYDFIIKKADEKSDTKVFAYTCKDQFVNELSKTGFELELDNELENNMGTIDKLAKAILENTDWELDCANSSNLNQYKEEPLYCVTINKDIKATVALTGEEKLISAGKDIYVFYSSVNDKKSEWWFLYTDDKFKTNDDLLIDREHPNYFISVDAYDEWPSFVAKREDGAYLADISFSYRGERLVKQAQTRFDSTIDKYVGVYQKDGKEYYGYTQTEYSTSATVTNYVANPNNFTSTTGWQTDKNKLDYNLTTIEESDFYRSFIEVLPKNGAYVLNTGISGNRSIIESFSEGEKYILRMKYKTSLLNQKAEEAIYSTTPPTVKICKYYLDDNGYYILQDTDVAYSIFEFNKIDLNIKTNELKENNEGNYEYLDLPDPNYIYMSATCLRSISRTELVDWDFKIGLFFDFSGEKVYIEDVQVFPYKTYIEEGIERLCVPGGKLFSEIKTKYVYYEPNSSMKSIDDLKPTYCGYSAPEGYSQVYASDSQIEGSNEFTKIRSISGKESNRFNLLQDLCEAFECWMKIKVERNKETGEIKQDNTGRYIKRISFHEFSGKDNDIGFRYGINSKSIQRTLDSAAIVSKMIVKDNANEFAPNGFCSIARASENPTGENFLLNFDHYIRHGLLDFDVITNDLYVSANGYLGYYSKLKEINAQRDELVEKQSGLLADMSRYDSAYTTYKTSYDSAIEEQLITERDILHYTNHKGEDFDSVIATIKNEWNDDTKFMSYWAKWCQCENVIRQHKDLYLKAESNLNLTKTQYDSNAAKLKEWTDEKRRLGLEFYKKYSRFIQEGSWIKEDYTDPNLYYLDSESTLHTSAQPKVTYNIGVIDVAPLASQESYEDFVYYDFDIGDKTYIEDVEFFGHSLRDGKTPYREEIIVSEIITELDAPEKNQIKVQNYKTQFENLFQRITANTQQAEYHTGEYARAASVVEADGTISASTLENSFANNSFKLSNARDQSVVWDQSGITTTSLSNPSEMVRIISGGVFLSNDGGQSWKTGITGSGINTSYLTAGQINTNEIYIMNGNNAAFRWDELGLAAYDRNQDGIYNPQKFVRFDHNGLYGVQDENKDYSTLENIQNNAPFSLSWDGFNLNNEDGSVRISSKQDIQVLKQGQERIKIGRLGNNTYGIKISDENGAVMETDSTGELWLRNRLRIGVDSGSTVEIGYLKPTEGETEGETIHKVISAGQGDTCFEVYEDGTMMARGATFKGKIIATGGSIGSVSLSENGITVSGTGFQILDKEGKPQLYLTENGTLCVTGTINATSGNFNGCQIGGFTIYDNKFVSNNGAIELNGSNEEIKVSKIYLGEGAQIENYIKLGQAYIRNPIKNGNVFIESKSIKIMDNGIANFGEIEINGEESKISGKGFYIKPGEANFANVTIRGKINTSIFEKGSSQVVGGAFLFLDSVKVLNQEAILNGNQISGYEYHLEKEIEDPIEKLIWIIDTNQNYTEAQIIGVKDGGKTIVIGQEGSKVSSPDLIVLVGKKGDLVMGINSGNSPTANGALLARGLTLREHGNSINTPQLFLGDLKSLGISNYSGYGLYSDNVYLRGSLTTLSSTGKSAGVNTKSGVKGDISIIENDSPIIFWAGSAGTDESSIQNAPFQVTEDGYIYAKQAKLEGSVFANGEIIGTTLKTAKIVGWEQENSSTTGNQAALSIYGTVNGIGFYDTYDANKKIFSIGSKGFVLDNDNLNFISLENNKVRFVGDSFQVGREDQAHLLIQKENSLFSIQHIHSSANKCAILFKEGETSYELNGKERLKIDSTSSTFSGNFSVKDRNEQIEYRSTDGGYDLYVIYDTETKGGNK